MKSLIRPGRVAAMVVMVILILIIYLTFLYRLQIIEGEKYYNQSNEITNTERTVTAARGNILDRYGRVMVSNKECYNLKIDNVKLFANEDPNAVILELVKMVESYGDTYTDDLPISRTPPFTYDENMTAIQRTMLNKYLTLRILTSMGNANAVNDYDISIGQSNTLVYEGAANSSRNNDSYRSNDCITSICQDSSVAAYTPVSSMRWYWIHAYNAAETIKGIALNAATTNGVVRVQVKGYIPLPLLTADTFTEGTLLGWNGTAYVEDTTHPLLKVIGGNVAQIIANGQ